MQIIKKLLFTLLPLVCACSNPMVHALPKINLQKKETKSHIKKIAFVGGTTIFIGIACFIVYTINRKNTNSSQPIQPETEPKDDTIIDTPEDDDRQVENFTQQLTENDTEIDTIEDDGHVEYFTQEPIDDDTKIDTIEDDGYVEYFTQEPIDDDTKIDTIEDDGHVEYFTQEPIDDDTEIDTIEDDGYVEYFTQEPIDDEKESQKYDWLPKKVKDRLEEEKLIEKEESLLKFEQDKEDKQDKERAEVLTKALKEGESLDRIKELLGDLLNVELDVEVLQENTALHYASQGGNKEVVGFFIKELVQNREMSIDKKDKTGRTALHYAAWKGNLDAVKCLIEAGSHINEPQETGAPVTRTALHYAAYSGEPEILNYLIEHDAETNIKNLFLQKSPLDILRKKHEDAYDNTERERLQSMIDKLYSLMPTDDQSSDTDSQSSHTDGQNSDSDSGP